MNAFESRLAAGLGIPPEKTKSGSPVYLAAVSGGADSTAMLAGLAELRKDYGFTLHCIHVEHGLRPARESRGDAAAVKALSEKLELPCRVVSFPPGKIAAFASSGGPGIEGAARFFRHRAWNREARRIGADKILTAHTRDDLLETLLMRVLRGAGPAGLAPMPRSRGRVLRPLLDLGRQDVLAYLAEKKLPYRVDSTNDDIRFLRNRVRHKLIPFLDEFFPPWRNSILALAETQALTAEFLAEEARRRLPWESPGSGKSAAGELFPLRLREDDFLNAPPILREEAVFAAADMLAAKAPSGARGKGPKIPGVPRRAAVRRAVKMEASLPGDLGPIRIERRGGFIEAAPVPRGGGERGFSLLIKEAGFYTLKGKVWVNGNGGDLIIRAGVPSGAETGSREDGFFPAGSFYAARFPLVFRGCRGQDRIFRAGHKRRLSDILSGEARLGYTGFITAEDADGPAAFIGVSRNGELLVIPREDSGNAGNIFPVEVALETDFPNNRVVQ